MIDLMNGRPEWFVVVNPAAGGGRAARRWPVLARALREARVGFEAAQTVEPGHATELAREAVFRGHRRLLAVGGDGVLHEVVNGLMSQRAVDTRSLSIGAAPLGSGNDWARGRRIPRRLRDLARCLAAGHTTPHDVGVLEFPECGGRTCFINVAGAGFDAHVLERLPAGLARRLGYLVGVLEGLRSFEPPLFSVDAGDSSIRARLMLALLAIGPYCGGGMRLAAPARTDDGLLDVVTIEPMSLAQALPKLPRLFDGRLLKEHFVRHFRAHEVSIDCDRTQPVEADGQLVGRTPVRARLLPAAIGALSCRRT